MYAIMSGGEAIALCDAPRYVRRNDNNIYVEADKSEADAIAVCGTLYNLPGGGAIEGAPEAVAVRQEAGEYILGNRAKINAAGASITGLEDAACDLDALTEGRVSALEDAVCELDAALNGGE